MFAYLAANADPFGSRCRDPKTGFWIPTDECPLHDVDDIGRSTTFAIGPNGVTRYELRHDVVSLQKLIASHDHNSFEPNPKFPQELQPRLRDRTANRVQVENLAQNIDATALIEDFHALDRGSPIVGDDLIVESGNGRVMALKLAAERFKNVYESYRSELLDRLPALGLPRSAGTKLKTPVLVRVRLTQVDRREFVQEANSPSTLSTSAVETARSDAGKITLEMLQELDVAEDESIEDALRNRRNASFVNRFLGKLTQNEQASLVDSNGLLNQDGLRRVVAAIFVRAFPGDSGLALAEKVFETLDLGIRNVITGISRAVGPLASVEALTEDGRRDSELSIGPDLAAVVPVFVRIRQTSGATVSDYLDQEQLFGRELTPFQETLLIFLDANSRSGRKIGQALRNYAESVIALPPPEQTSFIDLAPPSKVELWTRAVEAEPERDPSLEPALFQLNSNEFQLAVIDPKGRIREVETFDNLQDAIAAGGRKNLKPDWSVAVQLPFAPAVATAAQPPKVQWQRDESTGEDLVYVPDITGPFAWAQLHSWAQNVHDFMCPNCGAFAIKATRALHDVVNVKLGKPVQDQSNLSEIAGIFRSAAAGELRDELAAAQQKKNRSAHEHMMPNAKVLDLRGSSLITEITQDAEHAQPRSSEIHELAGHGMIIACPVDAWNHETASCEAKGILTTVLHHRYEESELIAEADRRGIPIVSEAQPNHELTEQIRNQVRSSNK